MQVDLACRALREGRCLELHYDGWSRTVEVHAVGYTKDGHAVMRVWQTRGGSNSNEPVGWKLLRLGEIWRGDLGGPFSDAPRDGYKRSDRAMARIVCQV